MARYVRKPARSFYVDDEVFGEPSRNVVEVPEHEPVFTGLLDADGGEIWREPRPIGFGRDSEW